MILSSCAIIKYACLKDVEREMLHLIKIEINRGEVSNLTFISLVERIDFFFLTPVLFEISKERRRGKRRRKRRRRRLKSRESSNNTEEYYKLGDFPLLLPICSLSSSHPFPPHPSLLYPSSPFSPSPTRRVEGLCLKLKL